MPGGGCGDGGPAPAASLSFPKGLAVAVDRSIYISDGKVRPRETVYRDPA